MYQIYIDRDKTKIQVKRLLKSMDNYFTKESLQKAQENKGEIVRYNEYYYFSTSRKTLLEFGRKIKQNWIEELREEIKRIEAIEI